MNCLQQFKWKVDCFLSSRNNALSNFLITTYLPTNINWISCPPLIVTYNVHVYSLLVLQIRLYCLFNFFFLAGLYHQRWSVMQERIHIICSIFVIACTTSLSRVEMQTATYYNQCMPGVKISAWRCVGKHGFLLTRQL